MSNSKILTSQELGDIEARAKATTPRYCVDWEKGHHAWLQDSGWKSASEPQPRTIATFDKDDGYLDLLFCAEAKTDIPALCATVRHLLSRLADTEKDLDETIHALTAVQKNYDFIIRERDRLADAATSLCVEKVKAMMRERVKQSQPDSEDHVYDQAVAYVLSQVAEELQSLTLQEQ